jgi:protocatechuate 3,4-dioxygenase beta subunit
MRFGALALAIGLSIQLAVGAADTKPAAAVKPAPAATPAPKPAPIKTITGKVVLADGKPAAAATVRAIPTPKAGEGSARGPARPDVPKSVVAKTDAAGNFKLEGLSGGSFALRVEAPGFAPAFAGDVPLGAALNLRLKPGIAVAGRVLDLTTQRPVAAATITGLERDASRFGRSAAHTTVSAEDGTFQLADCAPGVVVVEAIAPGKARARLDRVVAKPLAPGEERKPDANTLYLQPGGRIAGRVVGPDGKALADAIVTANASDGSLFAMMRDGRSAQRTDDDGKFNFDGVVAGNKYTVRATKEGLASRDEGPIQIEAGTDRGDLELKLDSGATLAFRLVTAQDAPVKDVEARLQPQGGGRRRGFGFGAGDVDRDKIVPQGDGKFLIKALDPGTFDLTLQPPDFADVSREGIRLRAGETTDLGTLRVKESKSIAGRITDATGQPVEGASISGMSFEGEARLSREAHSAADGRYRLSGLGDQPIRNLTVRATGYADANREGATPGETAVDFTLEKTGSVVGRVQLQGGAVPAAFRVQAFPEAKEKQERPGMRIVVGGRPDEDQVFTDPSGNFRLDGVDPGVVTITAKADGKAPARKTGLKVVSDSVVDVGTLTLEDGRSLRGRVVAAKDDAPIAGATISLSPPQGFMMSIGRDTAVGTSISALDGRFEIAGLEPRAYSVDASQPDYSPNSGRVEIGADADTDDFVIKLSRGGTITGLVRDAQKQPLTNASVLLTKIPMAGGPQTVSTGADGRYTFEKIAPGEYMVIKAPTNGGPLMLIGGMKQVEVKEGETTVHDLDDASKINLTGRVLKAGQPVANAMMFFTSGDNGGAPTDLRQSRTDADGRYQVGLDAAGTYNVMVSSMGGMLAGRQSAVPVQVPDQPNPVVDVTVKAAGISGRVTNVDGKPVSGAVVTLTPSGEAAGDGHRGGGLRGQSEPDGTFLIDGLTPGTYAVAVAASGYKNPTVPPVTITNETDVPAIDVRLEPGRTVRGHVLDANGNGIAGAMVMTAPSGSMPSGRDALTATSDVNGAFILTAGADGPIDLTAVAAGFPPARAVSVTPEDGVDITLRAPKPGHVRITVTNASGAVQGASVTCRAVPDYLGAGMMFMDRTPPTGVDGATTVSSLAPGAYELTVTSGSKRATQSVTLAEGAEVVTAVALP